MKKIFSILTVLATLFAVSCSSEYDDTAVWDELGKHNERISKLETLCGQMNTNISSLQAIVTALLNNDYVTGVAPITQNGVEIGYTISFSKSGSITIYHGKDGKDGVNGADGKDGINGTDGVNGTNGIDGTTPIIGVKQDTDGIYYWTVNGEWLLNDRGEKVKAVGSDGKNGTNGEDGVNGTDGITPQLKIENDYWYISYDEGATWTQVGKAKGEDGQDGANGADGDSFFQSVTQDENNVIFTLIDGTVLTLPKSSSSLFNKLQSVSYIPRYEDGKATVYYSAANNSQVEMDFEVSPKDAAAEIAAQWETILSLKAVNTQTRAITYIDMPILGCTADTEKGIITATASGSNLSEDFFAGTQPASARLGISDGNTNITSDFIPLVVVKQPNNEIWYTSKNRNIVKPYKTDVFGAKVVSNTYENGKGIITFNGEVTKIGRQAFRECRSLTSVTIPDSVTEIGSQAFCLCDDLTSVTIPDSVTSIGDYAFSSCDSLTSITIPDSVTSIGKNPFEGCENLAEFKGKFAADNGSCLIIDGVLNSFAPAAGITTYNIPDSVTSIGDYAFLECSGLTSVTIPNSVTGIGFEAFFNCSGLTNITIGNGVTEIEPWAFASCISLTSVTIPDSVTEIGNYAFQCCRSLTSITIPDSVSIGNYAFHECSGLTSVTIPDSVTEIGDNPFNGCVNLAEFKGKFAADNGRCLIIDGVLNSFAPAGLTEYTIPNSVTEIGKYAFWKCSGLTSITIPDGITSIRNKAFGYCSGLTSITIPDSVTEIGDEAFMSCTSLKEVYCRPTTPPEGGWDMFSEDGYGTRLPIGCMIYVPASDDDSIINAYKTQNCWRNYASYIVEYEFTE